MIRNVGVWVDSHHAYIVAFQDGKEYVHTLDNNLETFQHKEGSKGGSPWGPQDIGSEVKEDRRRANQMHRFFRAIIEKCRSASSIYIIGPSTAKLGLEKEFKKEPEQYRKIIAVESADKMSERRLVAHFRDYYKYSNENFEDNLK